MSGFRRRLMAAQGGMAALPYITDGLVACWDGIWNSGINKHSNDIADFKELVLGGTVLVGAYAIWTSSDLSNDYSITNKGIYNNVKDKSIGIAVPLEVNLGYGWTIEVVRNITQLRSANHGNEVGTNPHRGRLEIHNYYTNGMRVKGENSTGGGSGEWSIGNILKVGLECTTIRLSSSKVATLNYNDSKYTRNALDIYLTDANVSGLSFGTSGHVGELNCFRVYNRVLTDEERAFNYQIDKNRYGL